MRLFNQHEDPHKRAMRTTGGDPEWQDAMNTLGKQTNGLLHQYALVEGVRTGKISPIVSIEVIVPLQDPVMPEFKNVRLVTDQTVQKFKPQIYDQDSEIG